uniref:Uncharacterized protein n=1 Tax=Strongyloides stercoralis TaxID=6248 RepID=A0A0K0EN44_STRER
MFVVIAFGILALILVGTFVVWFYELLSNNDIKKDIKKSNEKANESLFNERIIFKENLYNESECEELVVVQTSN